MVSDFTVSSGILDGYRMDTQPGTDVSYLDIDCMITAGVVSLRRGMNLAISQERRIPCHSIPSSSISSLLAFLSQPRWTCFVVMLLGARRKAKENPLGLGLRCGRLKIGRGCETAVWFGKAPARRGRDRLEWNGFRRSGIEWDGIRG